MARWESNSPYVNIDLNVSNIYLSGDYPDITFHFDCDFNYYCPSGWANMTRSGINFHTQVSGYDTETKTADVNFSLTAGQESSRYGANYYNPPLGRSRQRTVDVHAWVSNGNFTGGGWTTVPSPEIPAPTEYYISSITNITEHSVTVSHVLRNVRNYWYVNLYDEFTGKYWNLNNDSGNGTTTITGLNPNQKYRFRLRVLDRNYNYCYQASKGVIQDTTTLGKSSVSGNPVLTLGNSFTLNISGFSDNFTHTATFKIGDYSFSRTDLKRGKNTITPTTAQRDAIYSQITTTTSAPMSITLSTLVNGTSIGSTTANGTVNIDQTICRPVVNSFSYKDANSVSLGITGNNQYLIQNLSTVQVTSISASAKNKARMEEYSLNVAGQKLKGDSTTTSTVITSEPIKQVIDQLTVRATDSRGLEGFLTKSLPVGYCIPYELPRVNMFEVVRRNLVETTCILKLEASYSLVKIGSVNKNAISSVKYRYKLTTEPDTWGSLNSLNCTIDATKGTVKFDSIIIELDVDKSYNFEIQITDKGGTTTSQTVLVMGKPIMSLRKGSIGINKVPETGRALDVEGAIYTNEYAYAASGFLPTGTVSYAGNSSKPFYYGYFKNIYKNGVAVPNNNETPLLGTGNNWTYLKFPNGTLMQYRRGNVTIAYNTWSSGYMSFAYLPVFSDFGLAFTAAPIVVTSTSLNIQQDCYVSFIDPPSTKNVAPLRSGATYCGYAMSSDPELKGRTQTLTFEFFAIGRWK